MSEVDEQVEEVIEKKKRGRPRKEVVPSDEVIVKRPIGRPRKNVIELKEKLPRKKKEVYKFLGNEREYHQNYYKEKMIDKCNCMHCSKTFINKHVLDNHLRLNHDCKIIRLMNVIENVKDNL